MTVFRAATLRKFFFAIHAGAKELNCTGYASWASHLNHGSISLLSLEAFIHF